MPRVPLLHRRILLGAVGAVALAGCSAEPEYPAGQLRIAAGGTGGVYHAYANGIAAVVRTALPRLHPTVLATAASLENIGMIHAGRAEIGFTTADAASDAFHGTVPFPEPVPLAALGRIYDNYLHVVVRRDRDIARLAELRGRPFSIGAPASGTELFATRILPMVGLNPDRDLRAERLDPDVAADAVGSGRLDGMFFSGGIPTAAVARLARRTPIALLELAGFVPELRTRYGEVYVERSIPASAYGQPRPTATVGVANYLVVLNSMDDRLAYWVTRALFEHRDLLAQAHPAGSRLDRGAAVSTPPLPLHRGAARYYRAAKR